MEKADRILLYVSSKGSGRDKSRKRHLLQWEILSHDYSGCSISAQFWINEDK